MNNWPLLSVLLPTYNRAQILRETIIRLATYLQYSGKVQYLIGNDGDKLPNLDLSRLDVIIHPGPQLGLGGNLNMLIKKSSDLMLQMDDDHWIMKPIKIDEYVKKLYEDDTAGVIRLMGIGGHRYIAQLDGGYWRIDWNSPELYIMSNRPHLKRRRVHDLYGAYTENLSLGKTEETFCHQCIDWVRNGRLSQRLDALIPLDIQSESGWDHVGQSWQLKGF